MFPDQQNQNGGQPQPAQQPYVQPQTGVNSVPQQASNGQYAVVPPLPAANNTGHSGHNPYEFIMDPNQPKKRNLLAGGGKNSFLLRIGLLVGGVVIIMIIAAVVLSALGPKSSTPGLTAIAQRQQEIVRIATAATQKATDQNTLNFVTNVELSVTSSQVQVLNYLSSHGTKLSSKVLALDQDPKTDATLSSATSANTYNSTVAQTLSDELQTYFGLLKTTYKQTGSKTTKTLLQSCANSTGTLIKQAQSITSSSNS